MATTNFLQWNPGQANQESDSDYNADSQRSGGAVDNTPLPAPLGNKAFYQWSTFVAAFCQMMAAKGYSTSDADITTLQAVLANIVTEADGLPAITPLAYSPTPAFNAAASNGFQMTLTGNVTSSTVAGVTPGQLLAFYFVQDAIGGRTVAWPVSFAGAPQPDPAPNAVSVILFRADAAGNSRGAGPAVSNNGTFPAGTLTPSAFTLASGAPLGATLVGNGTLFVAVPANFSATPNGYAVDPTTGIITQWGTASAGPGGSHVEAPVSFPIPFPNACWVITATPAQDHPNGGSWAAITAMALNKTLSGFTLALDSSNTGQSFSNSIPAYWEARGI
jgi:hypothetical protein